MAGLKLVPFPVTGQCDLVPVDLTLPFTPPDLKSSSFSCLTAFCF